MTYTYAHPERVHLFGGGTTMYALCQFLLEHAIHVHIWTSPRHFKEDWQLVKAPPDRVRVTISEDINDDFPPVELGATEMGITFGPAWKFGPAIRTQFGYRLLDFMSIPFPRYQGGAHISWARMNGETEWGCCLQLVTEKTEQGVCHDGDVIAEYEFDFKEDRLEENYLFFLGRFFEDCHNGRTFTALGQVPPPIFYPRLNTDLHGWIDWSWSIDEIYRFINAFDKPYPGAQTWGPMSMVRVRSASVVSWVGSHRFATGMALAVDHSIDGHRTIVSAGSGTLSVILDKPVPIGERLWTGHALLRKAQRESVSYDAKGLVCPQPSPSAASPSATSLPPTSNG